MSGASSNAVAWFTRLEPAGPPTDLPRRPDDPRLGEVIEFWRGDAAALRPGRAVLIGFPQDEGVRRNGGRVGAAQAPDAIRRWLYRLTVGDPVAELQRNLWMVDDYGRDATPDLAASRPLDLGNVRITGPLEATQATLAEVIAGVLQYGAVPVVLGGGHETAYGVFLGYAAALRPVGVINIDAHLDVRPLLDGQGHSGSPFRQALEYSPAPLSQYVCLGAQPHATSREHFHYVVEHGGVVRWCESLAPSVAHHFATEAERIANRGLNVHLSIDADAVQMADVPGVSAPNPVGLAGGDVIAVARVAGTAPEVSGLDLVEINPQYDRDGQTARWAAVLIWNFLVGLLDRPRCTPECPK